MTVDLLQLYKNATFATSYVYLHLPKHLRKLAGLRRCFCILLNLGLDGQFGPTSRPNFELGFGMVWVQAWVRNWAYSRSSTKSRACTIFVIDLCVMFVTLASRSICRCSGPFFLFLRSSGILISLTQFEQGTKLHYTQWAL
jgi:hypothetical protein